MGPSVPPRGAGRNPSSNDQKRSRSGPHDGDKERREQAALDSRKEALLQDGGQHLATKVGRDLNRSSAIFKTKLLNLSYGADLERFIALIPPTMTQHLNADIAKFRSYQTRFTRGSNNHVMSFMKWYEWACFESGKNGKYHDNAQGAEPKEEAKPAKAPRTALGQVANQRKHIRALLAMCLRHNSSRRVEGLHALLNHLSQQLSGVGTAQTIDELRDSASPSVAYAFSRLVLGMATEHFANTVLHCHTLCEALQRCPAVANSVLLNILDAELAMATRIKAAEIRIKKDANTVLKDGGDELIDPDEIADPTVGERHQKTMAAIFTIVALLAAKREIKPQEANTIAIILSHCYIEHKGLRVLTGNVLLDLVTKYPATLNDPAVCEWLSHTHFKFSKVDYLRPEGIQLLMHLMTANSNGQLPASVTKTMPVGIRTAVTQDPLEPSMLEALSTALFRKEQVTACHPLPHPVWRQFIDLMEARAIAGESLKNHIANFVHNVITPFRRGAVDGPRQDLFRSIVQWIGQLGLKAVDEEDRAQAVKEAAALGFGKRMAVGKASTPQELRSMTIDELAAKLRSLLLQYEQSMTDKGMSAVRVRTWILREVKATMLVEHREGVRVTYADDVVKALFRFAFQRGTRRDTFNENKALYTLCDILSRSAHRTAKGTLRGRERTRVSFTPSELVQMYLDLEGAGKTRFNSCKVQKIFADVRSKIVDALKPDAPRSVLFYENHDIQMLLLLLFFVVSMDDPSNEVATGLAEASVNDLLQFYATGTLDSIEILVDVLMSFVMRPTAPLQITPIMATLRPIAISLLLRFSRFYRTRAVIDMIVQPLADAYGTDRRELLRQERARKLKEASEGKDEADDSDADDDVKDAKRSKAAKKRGAAAAETEEEEEAEDDDSEEEGTEADEEGTEDDEESDDATDVDEEGDEEEEDVDEEDDDGAAASDDGTGSDKDVDFDDDQSWAGESDDESVASDDPDQSASPAYLQTLQTMLGGAESAAHVYPTDVTNKEKSDVVRAATLISRIGISLRTPLMIHAFQVLLAVLRENLKEPDEVVFDAAKSAVELMVRSRNRYFGHFVNAMSPTLLVLLADIQSYCRKLETSLVTPPSKDKEGADAATSAQANARVRRRLAQLKSLSLSVMHFLGYLAYKNHADDAVRVTLMEHYRLIYCDRGWDTKRGPEYLRRDMFHFRHGFAWCYLDAIFSKYSKIKEVDSARRTFAFLGACDAIRAMLPRLAGLPADLKERCAASIRKFLQETPLRQIYDAKHTTLFDYFGAVKMTLEYNRRVHLDTEWAAEVLKQVTDDDEIQISNATARVCSIIEKLLNVTPRILNVKACVPQALLHRQHPTPWRRKVTRKHASANQKREKVETELLAIRNHEPTPEERQAKKHRREEMRRDDRGERMRLRKERWDNLTSDEKAEARRKAQAKKQTRIAQNHQRKGLVHERRAAALQTWRQEKMQAAGQE